MPQDLEAPAGADDEWSRLYRARGDEVVSHRPVFTGDVFESAEVVGVSSVRSRTVVVVQHPCAMRSDGVNMIARLLVAEVRQHSLIVPEDWRRHITKMPLPELRPDVDSNKRHQAGFFDTLYLAEPSKLGTRIACLSPRGVNLLLQRWVHHNSRVVVPTTQYSQSVGGVYEEADLIEEWCDERAQHGVDAAEATAECVAWLREDLGSGSMRQRLLEEEQNRSSIRKDMRQAIRDLT